MVCLLLYVASIGPVCHVASRLRNETFNKVVTMLYGPMLNCLPDALREALLQYVNWWV